MEFSIIWQGSGERKHTSVILSLLNRNEGCVFICIYDWHVRCRPAGCWWAWACRRRQSASSTGLHGQASLGGSASCLALQRLLALPPTRKSCGTHIYNTNPFIWWGLRTEGRTAGITLTCIFHCQQGWNPWAGHIQPQDPSQRSAPGTLGTSVCSEWTHKWTWEHGVTKEYKLERCVTCQLWWRSSLCPAGQTAARVHASPAELWPHWLGRPYRSAATPRRHSRAGGAHSSGAAEDLTRGELCFEFQM